METLNLTWGNCFNPVILFIPLQEVQAEAAAREGERRFGFDKHTAPLGQIYMSVLFSFFLFNGLFGELTFACFFI